MLVATKEKREAWLENRASSSNGEIVEKQWTELWRTKVPSKVRLFLWRSAKQSLPTNDVRHHRNMADNDRCQLCGGQDSWRHALIDCTMSRCVWALEDEEIMEHLQCSEEGDARAWLATMIATLKHEERVRVFVTSWSIWHARRKAIHEQIYQSPLSVHAFVNQFIADLAQARSPSSKQAAPGVSEPRPVWIPPPTGVLKINVDAAVSKNTGRGAVAAIARDHEGMFMGASAPVFPGNTDAETLEALACREGLALAQDIYARRIRLASDCAGVIRSLQQGTKGAYAHIVQEILETKQDFEEVGFCHEKRCSNTEAHSLARSSVLPEQGRQVWLVSPPEGFCIPVCVVK
jgi:ribonuclease HI